MIIPEEKVSVVDLVEDDLLLSIPGQVCPEADSCSRLPKMDYPPASVGKAQEPRAESPFQVLEKLKKPGNG